VFPILRTTLTRLPSWTQPTRSSHTNDPDLRRHADIDALVIGISHDHCDWGHIPSFSKQFSIKFRGCYEKRSGPKLHGSMVFGTEDVHEQQTKVAMRSLKQRLVAKVQLGSFICDLVVFGPESETYLQTDFYPRVRAALLLAAQDCSDESSSLNHLSCTLNYASEASAVLSKDDAVSFLRQFQAKLSPEHHVALISLGCKAMGVVKQISEEISGKALAGVYDALLCEHLELDQVREHATFLMCDNGIEFSSSGRFLHWKPEACQTFKNAMESGSLYFEFGIRRLTAFNTRAMLFERSVFLVFWVTNSLNRHLDHHGVVPQLSNRKKRGSTSSVIVGKCAYSRSSDMLGRGDQNPLTKINFLAHLTEVVLSSGQDTNTSRAVESDAQARQALVDAQSHVKEYVKRLGTQFREGRRVEARGEVTCVRFIYGEDDPEGFESVWISGVADVFDRLLIPGNLSSVDTAVLRDFSQYFTEFLWALMRRLGTLVLDARAMSSCFGLGRLQNGDVDAKATMLHLIAMVAFCEQTMTQTLPFCNVMGIPALCNTASCENGWENPMEAFVCILGRPEVDIARFISHNRLALDTKRVDVSPSPKLPVH
jgi:hypothetical protein